MYDFNVFRGFVGAHWVVFDCHTGRNVCQGTAETVEAAHHAASFEALCRTMSRQLEALVREVEAA